MAGFEGPRDPGADEPGATKLPSWAVTRPSESEEGDEGGPATRDTFADVGADSGAGRTGPRAEPPVVRVPEHPFDIDDPFGDKQLGGTSSPWIRPPADDTEVRVVDLADEFHLTTAQALEVCEASGTPASSGAAWLTLEQAAAFRTSVATYDRTEAESEEFPSWAVPPGGRRPSVDAAPPPEPVIPGATLLASTGPVDDDDEPERSGGGPMRVVLLVVALVAIAVLVAMLVL